MQARPALRILCGAVVAVAGALAPALSSEVPIVPGDNAAVQNASQYNLPAVYQYSGGSWQLFSLSPGEKETKKAEEWIAVGTGQGQSAHDLSALDPRTLDKKVQRWNEFTVAYLVRGQHYQIFWNGSYWDIRTL